MSRTLWHHLRRRFAPFLHPERRRLRHDPDLARAALAQDAGRRLHGGGPHPRVAVVGAGLGGLSAGWWLSRWGFRVTVYGAGAAVEGAADPVGRTHRQVLYFADRFGFALQPLGRSSGGAPDAAPQGLGAAQAEALFREMSGVLRTIAQDAATLDPLSPWSGKAAGDWDARVLDEWLERQEVSALCRQAVRDLLGEVSDGRLAEQTYLAAVARVAGAGVLEDGEPDIWTATDHFRAPDARQVLAEHFTRGIAQASGCRLVPELPDAVDLLGHRHARLGVRREPHDHFVFALPPERWDEVAVAPALPRHVDAGLRGRGQLTLVGIVAGDYHAHRLAFATEHFCPAFFGRLEGELEAGFQAALRFWREAEPARVRRPVPSRAAALEAPHAEEPQAPAHVGAPSEPEGAVPE